MSSRNDVLLHLCSPAEWRSALSGGVLAPPSLADVGFVHLSTPEQVHLPADRLFPGRRDMILLVVAPARLAAAAVEVRWEPGVPGDPESMRFPHAYGGVPTGAVLAVLPYRPDGAGRFAAPDVPVLDDAGRARRFRESVVRRVATREVEVTGGVAALTDALPASPTHNQVFATGASDTPTLLADVERVLGGAGLDHRSALVSEPAGAAAQALRAAGWTVEELVVMAGAVDTVPDGPTGRVVPAGPDEVRPLYDPVRRAERPDLTADQLDQLTHCHRIEDEVVEVRHLAVREGDRVVAACRVRLDGGTAWCDDLETAPVARGRGHAGELLRAAVGLARHAGCDLLALDTAADGWPRSWYRRLGLREVARTVRSVRA